MILQRFTITFSDAILYIECILKDYFISVCCDINHTKRSIPIHIKCKIMLYAIVFYNMLKTKVLDILKVCNL